MWATATPEQAYEVLGRPDVTVTNHKDKLDQLPLILTLDAEVRRVMRRTSLHRGASSRNSFVETP